MRVLFSAMAYIGMAVMVWSLFRYAARSADSTAADPWRNWRTGQRIGTRINVFPAIFVWTFDVVFGRRKVSLRSMFLSFAVSSLISILLFFLLQPLFGGTPLDLFNFQGQGGFRQIAAEYGFILLLVMLCGLVPGYLSLLATRAIIGHAVRAPFSRTAFAYLAVDIGATLLIMYASTIIYMSAASYLTGFLEMPLFDLMKMLLRFSGDLLFFNFNSQFHYFYAIPFYAIFWPSFWMWLSLAATLLAALLDQFEIGQSWLTRRGYSVEDAPVAMLGRMASIILITAGAATALFTLIRA